MNTSKAKRKKEYQDFLDSLSQEEFQKFSNAASQEEFPDAESQKKYIKFVNAKLQVRFLDEKLQERYQTLYNRPSDVKSKEDFLIRLNRLFEYLEKKEEKTEVESALFRRLTDVRNNVVYNMPLPYHKDGYSNTLVYFEMGGGWDMMVVSDIGKEATDLLNYFVQNY